MSKHVVTVVDRGSWTRDVVCEKCGELGVSMTPYAAKQLRGWHIADPHESIEEVVSILRDWLDQQGVYHWADQGERLEAVAWDGLVDLRALVMVVKEALE